MFRLARSLLTAVAVVVGFSGCTLFQPPGITTGETEAAIVARLGAPTARYRDGDTSLLEYRTGPGGQVTYMVRLDQSGHAMSIEQVLSTAKFASIVVNKDTQQDVLRKIGAPFEKTYLSIPDLAVWTYMYRENDAWDSLMHVHFDRNGIVRMLQNAPDLTRRPNAGNFGT